MRKWIRNIMVATVAAAALGGTGVALAGREYYAACESGHFYWESSGTASPDQARSYADAHDRKYHGGSRTAVVLDRDR
jgi:hypothetical protein